MSSNNHEIRPERGTVRVLLSPVPAAIAAPTLRHCLGLLSPEERARLRRLPARRRTAFLVAHVLLRHSLARACGMPARAVPLKRGPHGKPFLEGAGPAFSLSRAERWVALALADTGTRVGGDVEETSRLRLDPLRLARRCFHGTEHDWLASLPAAVRPRAFVDLWARKEAFCKAHGAALGETLPGPRFLATARGLEPVCAGASYGCRRPAPGVAVITCVLGESGHPQWAVCRDLPTLLQGGTAAGNPAQGDPFPGGSGLREITRAWEAG